MSLVVWDLRSVSMVTNKDRDKVNALLEDGWEPFAVTGGGMTYVVYHLRRRVIRGSQEVEE